MRTVPSIYDMAQKGTLAILLLTILLYQVKILAATSPDELAGLAEITKLAAYAGLLYALLPMIRPLALTGLHRLVGAIEARTAGGDDA